MKIVTFNLRCLWLGDGINSFMHRVGMILDKIDERQPDIICFQEATEKNSDFLKRHLPEYELHYRGRNEDMYGEGLMIALRKERFELAEIYSKWLSPTPYKPGSKFPEQGPSPRILLACVVRDKLTGKFYRFYDLHLEFRRENIRMEQIKYVISLIAEDNSNMPFPSFLMGDFNSPREMTTYKYCVDNDVFPLTDLTPDIPVTSHGFGINDPGCQIDFIFSDSNTAINEHSYCVWDDCEDGIFMSDHYPVELNINL